MGKKIYVVLVLISIVLGFVFGKVPETSLLKSVLPESSSLLIKAAEKNSFSINIVFEAEDAFEAEILKEDFLSDFGQNNVQNADYEKYLDDCKNLHSNFLSQKDFSLLSQKKYGEVFNNSRNYLYNPSNIIFLDPKDDPFMLFSDFVSSLMQKQVRYNTEYNGKGYAVSTVSDLDNTQIKRLFELQKKYSIENKNVYLTGTPVHSYLTSERSAFEINVIAIISSVFVLALVYFYFRKFQVLVPIIASIAVGILTGYSVSSLLFKNVHVLTFVFSTTLIGICVDYSLHRFVESDCEKLFKSLTNSLITTVAAFAVLLFSGIPLLKQISVFTSVGLVTVYFAVKYFYSAFSFDIVKKTFLPEIKMKYKKLISLIFLLFIAFGLSKITFTDDVKSLYKPSKSLAMAEKTLYDISVNKSPSLFIVLANNIQEVLEKEEKLKDYAEESVSLSDFVPSFNRQKQNFEFVKNLYDKKLPDCVDIFSANELQSVNLSEQKEFLSPDFQKYSFLKKFLIDENTSIMVVNGKVSKGLNIDGVKQINIANDVSSVFFEHRKNCLKLVCIAFFILFAYLYFFYKKRAIQIILPSFFGILTSLAALGVTGQAVNLFHIFAMFLILGFTLDYSIFRISGIEKSNDAVLISCLTTSFSFFLLIFTSFKLISSLGFVLSIGLMTSYLFSLILIKNGDKNEVV